MGKQNRKKNSLAVCPDLTHYDFSFVGRFVSVSLCFHLPLGHVSGISVQTVVMSSHAVKLMMATFSD